MYNDKCLYKCDKEMYREIENVLICLNTECNEYKALYSKYSSD